MERKEKLLKLFESITDEKKELVVKLIDEMLFLESELEKIKKIPFYRIANGKIYQNESLRVYKDLTLSYNTDIKTLFGFLKVDNADDSMLSTFLKELK